MPFSASSSRDYRATFTRDGVVHVPGFLPVDELRLLTENLERYIRDVAPTMTDGTVIYDDPSRPETLRVLENLTIDPFFLEYGKNPRFMSLAEVLLGTPVTHASVDQYSAYGWQAFFDIPPGVDASTPPHQDNYYYKFEPAETLAIWVALDAVEPENGGMRYVRGSHARPLREHNPGKVAGFSQVVADFGSSDIENEITFALAPGDAVVHHGKTIHRSTANRTSGHRRGYSMFLRSARSVRNEVEYARYLDSLRAHNERFGLVQ